MPIQRELGTFRPGGLTDGPRTGIYCVITDPKEKASRPTHFRADVVDFMRKLFFF